MKKSFRKLSLNRETLRHLERHDLGLVRGGTDATVDSCNTVCASCKLDDYSGCACTVDACGDSRNYC
jgi:hypothetical protein